MNEPAHRALLRPEECLEIHWHIVGGPGVRRFTYSPTTTCRSACRMFSRSHVDLASRSSRVTISTSPASRATGPGQRQGNPQPRQRFESGDRESDARCHSP
jgi:hypothetical protein